MRILYKNIRKIDQFGPSVQLRLHKKKQHKTVFGGIFTIVLCIATLVVMYSYFLEMINRENPIMIYSEEFWNQNLNRNLLTGLFTLGIGVYDVTNNEYLQDIQIILNVQNQQQSSSYQLQLCNQSSEIWQENNGYTYQYQRDSLHCLSESNLESLLSLTIEESNQIVISLSFQRKSDHIYELRYLQQDHFIEATNYNQPFKKFFNQLILQLKQSSSKINVIIGYQIKKVYTEHGYFQSNMQQDTQMAIDSINYFERNTNAIDNPIKIQYIINKKIQTIKRDYTRLLGVLSLIGGFIKSMVIVFTIITKPFTKVALYVSLLNNLFTFNSDEFDQNNSEIEQKQQDQKQYEKELEENNQLNEILNNEYRNQKNGIIQDNQKLDKSERLFRKFMKIGEKTLIMSIKDYIKHVICCFCSSKKKQLIKKSMKKVNERLDITYILQKLVEVDKLKMILLNDQQRMIFDYLPKPLVKTDEAEKDRNSLRNKFNNQTSNIRTEWSLFHTEMSTLQKAILAIQAFKYIMNTDTSPLSIIDLKLIEMLDPQIVNRFSAIKLLSIQEIIEVQKDINKQNINLEIDHKKEDQSQQLNGNNRNNNIKDEQGQKLDLQQKQRLLKQSFIDGLEKQNIQNLENDIESNQDTIQEEEEDEEDYIENQANNDTLSKKSTNEQKPQEQVQENQEIYFKQNRQQQIRSMKSTSEIRDYMFNNLHQQLKDNKRHSIKKHEFVTQYLMNREILNAVDLDVNINELPFMAKIFSNKFSYPSPSIVSFNEDKRKQTIKSINLQSNNIEDTVKQTRDKIFEIMTKQTSSLLKERESPLHRYNRSSKYSYLRQQTSEKKQLGDEKIYGDSEENSFTYIPKERQIIQCVYNQIYDIPAIQPAKFQLKVLSPLNQSQNSGHSKQLNLQVPSESQNEWSKIQIIEQKDLNDKTKNSSENLDRCIVNIKE